MKRFAIIFAAPMLFLFASACEKDKSAEPAAAAPSAAAATQAAPIANENIPVAADFEEDAERTITAANYKKELDSLEAEAK